MSASHKISRRALIGGTLALGFGERTRAQGFAGLDENAEGFAPVVPGKAFAFPADHGPHPEFRIEWWYVTANLADANGAAYGAQWTLFRQATRPGARLEGWANQQVWMGRAAVTRADARRSSETFARGGVEQAGVEPPRSSPRSMPGRYAASINGMPTASPRSNSRRRRPISAMR